MAKSWFDVDRLGFRELISNRDLWRLLVENVSNSFDANAKDVYVGINREPHSPKVTVSFRDDGEGFSDIALAYTFYSPTDRRSDPMKRGRFTQGEKNILAVADEALIESRSVRLVFDEDGRHISQLRKPRTGTVVDLTMRCNMDTLEENLQMLKRVHPPDDVKYNVSGEIIEHREVRTVFQSILESPIRIAGTMKNKQRETSIRIFDVPPNEKPYLFELGIPVQEIGCPFDVDIQQKIPLSPERDMVKESYLRDVYAEVLRNMIDQLPDEETAKSWVSDGMVDERCPDEVVAKIKEKRFGSKVALRSSDMLANERALGAGWNVVDSRVMNPEERERFISAGVLEHTSDIFGLDVKPATMIEPNAQMLRFEAFAKRFTKALTGQDITFSYYSLFGGYAGADISGNSRSCHIRCNIANLSYAFFDPAISEKTIGLLLHELPHTTSDDPDYMHGSHYQNAAEQLAGKAVLLARDHPEMFKETNDQ